MTPANSGRGTNPLALRFFFWLIVLLIVVWGIWGIRVVREWERLAILTLGHYTGLKGPGLVIVWPVAQTVASRVDLRVVATSFQSETTLTRDSVAVTVKAVLFWRVVDAEKATLAVEDYRQAVQLAAQTSLRDAIGRTSLADLLPNLEQADAVLRETITAKTEPWGIQAQSVEIRDVAIPADLQEAMSRGAQAEREKEARIIYGQAEAEAAKKFVEAARTYLNEPVALQLRAMSIMYEAVKSERNTIIVVPNQMADSLGQSSMMAAMSAGMTAAEGGKGPADAP